MYYYYVCTNLSKNDKEYFVTFYRDGFHEYMIKTNMYFVYLICELKEKKHRYKYSYQDYPHSFCSIFFGATPASVLSVL